MYKYQDSFGWFIPSVYFILVILICSFFILNLTVAIMLDRYESIEKEMKMMLLSCHEEFIEIGRKAELPEPLI